MTAPSPFINAGDLIHRITFEARSAGSDANGGPTSDWTPVATVSAAIENLSGRELIAAQAINSDISHQIVVRYRHFLANPTAVAAMRIRFRGTRVFNIHQATNTQERSFEVVILASEGMNLG